MRNPECYPEDILDALARAADAAAAAADMRIAQVVRLLRSAYHGDWPRIADVLEARTATPPAASGIPTPRQPAADGECDAVHASWGAPDSQELTPPLARQPDFRERALPLGDR